MAEQNNTPPPATAINSSVAAQTTSTITDTSDNNREGLVLSVVVILSVQFIVHGVLTYFWFDINDTIVYPVSSIAWVMTSIVGVIILLFVIRSIEVTVRKGEATMEAGGPIWLLCALMGVVVCVRMGMWLAWEYMQLVMETLLPPTDTSIMKNVEVVDDKLTVSFTEYVAQECPLEWCGQLKIVEPSIGVDFLVELAGFVLVFLFGVVAIQVVRLIVAWSYPKKQEISVPKSVPDATQNTPNSDATYQAKATK